MILYSLLDKFGDEKSEKRFKEVVSMTDVGKMIYNEGLKKWNWPRYWKRKSWTIIKVTNKKIQNYPNDYKSKIMNLPQETLYVIATEIFNMDNLDDLIKYLN